METIVIDVTQDDIDNARWLAYCPIKVALDRCYPELNWSVGNYCVATYGQTYLLDDTGKNLVLSWDGGFNVSPITVTLTRGEYYEGF